MLFQFLKYIQPTNYFTHSTVIHSSIFPDTAYLEDDIKSQLVADIDYKSDFAKNYDLSWQAVQLGYTGHARVYHNYEIVPLVDEYHFIRKYFNPIWAFYILILRLFSLKKSI